MNKYVVTGTMLISTEVEAETPLDAKAEALENSEFETQLHNTEVHLEVYRKGDEPIHLVKEKVLEGLQRYLELTQEPNEDGTATDNPEWDRGFQAAMALVRGME